MSILASDNFNRANETPLASPWTKILSSIARDFDLSSNTCVPHSLSLDTAWYYSGVSFPNDQYVQAKITVNNSTAGNGPGVAIRAITDNSALTFYRLVVSHAASNNVDFSKIISGTKTAIASRSTTWVDGDTLRGEAQGTTFRLYQNGSKLGVDITDSAIASGAGGVSYSSSTTSASIDDWEAGDLTTTTPFVGRLLMAQQTFSVGSQQAGAETPLFVAGNSLAVAPQPVGPVNPIQIVSV